MPRQSLTVLLICSGDLWAGAEVMIFNLVEKLKEKLDIKIIAIALNEGVLANKLRKIGIETHTIKENSHSFIVILIKIIRLLKGRKINVIHTHRYKENFLGFILAKILRVDWLIATIHGLAEPLYLKDRLRKSRDLKTRMDYFILRKCFSRVVAVSNEMKGDLLECKKFKGEKVVVIHNGINILNLNEIAKMHNPTTLNPVHIGTVGRMVPVKDYHLFLQIAAEISEKYKNIKFSILGDGPLKNNLIQTAKHLKIEDNVEFVMPRIDPYQYYQSIDIYLNTSIHEGIPMSILEAMACGKPVVAPRVGGIPEIISHGENGLLVLERKSNDFVQSCLQLLENSVLRDKISKNATKSILESFDSNRMAASYHELYCGWQLSKMKCSS